MLKASPLPAASFPAWLERSTREYIEDLERGYLMTPQAAREKAHRQMQELLPQATQTPDHWILEFTNDEGVAVGNGWYASQGKDAPGKAWIYNLYIHPPFRGQGYGRGALQLLQAEALRRGFQDLGLHVFGFNAVALALYQSEGFDVMGLSMNKSLR